MDVFAYAPLELKCFEPLANTFIIPARQNQLFKENILNNDPARRNAFAMNTVSAFTVSYAENQFRYQQIDLRQIRILRSGQPTVDFDAADICCLILAIMKAINLQGDILSVTIDKFKNHYVSLFDLVSMQDATENFLHPGLVRKPLEINSAFPL